MSGWKLRSRGRLEARGPTGHTGAIVLVLLVGSAVLALCLARLYDLGVAQTLVSVLIGGGAPPGLYLAWAAYRDDRRDAVGGKNLAEVAENLAEAVRRQWREEARLRALYAPYPLPVSWVAADASLADGWDMLVRLATSSGNRLPPPEGWARGPADLAGSGSDLVRVLGRVPTGRLVVLGEPGAGKSMLMVRLLLDLLDCRASGGPVPVLIPLSSWSPATEDLYAWLGRQMTIDYPALAAAAPAGSGRVTLSTALLEADLLLPILDGLDEIPEAVRGKAIARINDALLPGRQLVVTCRTTQYSDAVRASSGARLTLRAAAVVQLTPLDAEAVSGYLLEDAADPHGRERWAPVLEVLGTEAPAGQALTTPLMVTMARTIYSPRHGEAAEKLPDPADLCHRGLADQEAVAQLLFDAFIPAAYREGTAGRGAQQAEKWLVFLARHLDQTVDSPDFAWWQLQLAAPAVLPMLHAVLILGATAGLVVGSGTWFLIGHVAGLGPVAGLVAGLLAGLACGLASPWFAGWLLNRFMARDTQVTRPSNKISFSADGLWHDLTHMAAYGVFVGLLAGGLKTAVRAGLAAGNKAGLAAGNRAGLEAAIRAGLEAGARAGIRAGLSLAIIGGLIGLAIGLVGEGLTTERGDLAAAVSPRAVLARDRRATLIPPLLMALLFGLVAGLGVRLLPTVRHAFSPGAVLAVVLGIAAGLYLGLLLMNRETAWQNYELARIWLALRHRLPWRLTGFLADAHRRGVLRQQGAVYQFRHLELQRRLATRR